MRAFLGLVNSIRRVIPFKVIEETMILTPLTSANKDVLYIPNEEHHQAFENVKKMLISEPLFCHLIDPKATKYLFLDASTNTGCLSAVLLQRIDGEKGEKILPTALDLDDPILCVWTMFNKLETNAVQKEILDRYINKYTSVYGEKIREICKAAEIRQSITDQLVTASPQKKVLLLIRGFLQHHVELLQGPTLLPGLLRGPAAERRQLYGGAVCHGP